MSLRTLAAVLLASVVAGCAVPGLIYSNVTFPLDLDASATVIEPGTGRSDWKTFNYAVQVDWDSSAIADAARQAGLVEIHFADMEITSVLLGVWVRRTAIVYGH